jgi:hypothetical protein
MPLLNAVLDALQPIVQQDPSLAMAYAIGIIYVVALLLAMRY